MNIVLTDEARKRIMGISVVPADLYKMIDIKKDDIKRYYAELTRALHPDYVERNDGMRLVAPFDITAGTKFFTNPATVQLLNNQSIYLPPVTGNLSVETQLDETPKEYEFNLADPGILSILIDLNIFHMFVDALYAILDVELRDTLMGIMKLSLSGDAILYSLLPKYTFSYKVSGIDEITKSYLVLISPKSTKSNYAIDIRILRKFISYV